MNNKTVIRVVMDNKTVNNDLTKTASIDVLQVNSEFSYGSQLLMEDCLYKVVLETLGATLQFVSVFNCDTILKRFNSGEIWQNF